MSDQAEPRPEHPSTYVIEDRSSETEMTRLHIQDQLLTSAMGGVLPEQPDHASFQRIIDVGCGTGDWLIETATTYPSISLLIGVDISNSMIEFARMQAAAAGVNDRVEFHVMDALRMLEFPEAYFDLVTHRGGELAAHLGLAQTPARVPADRASGRCGPRGRERRRRAKHQSGSFSALHALPPGFLPGGPSLHARARRVNKRTGEAAAPAWLPECADARLSAGISRGYACRRPVYRKRAPQHADLSAFHAQMDAGA